MCIYIIEICDVPCWHTILFLFVVFLGGRLGMVNSCGDKCTARRSCLAKCGGKVCRRIGADSSELRGIHNHIVIVIYFVVCIRCTCTT